MSRYSLVSTWRVPGTVEEVAAVLSDARRLPEWWPAVYLSVEERAPGDASGIGRELDLHTRGWLPYTLRWRLRVVEVEPPGRLVVEPSGDLVGRGEWTLWQEGPVAVARYDWQVEARKPLLRALGWLLHPVFAANHNWAMRRGEDSLRLELERRRAPDAAARARVPPPPGRARRAAR